MTQENKFIPNQDSYKPLTPFQLFVKSNFPFIENTFESLDNYGLYCKIVEYLNTVIENENTVESNVQSLYDAFVSLNTYVSNYFDNLDVQDEINNKLDEMAETGALQDIVNNIFNSLEEQISSVASGAPSGVYATVSDLETADPNHNHIYIVLSNGNWYYYNSTNSEWTSGGVYQGTLIGENIVDFKNLSTNVQNEIKAQKITPTVSTGENKYISSGGTEGANNAFNFTDIIELKRNETIIVKANAGTSISVISSKYRSRYTPLAIGTNTDNTMVTTYKYVAKSDLNIVISYRKSVGVEVYKTSVNQNTKNSLNLLDEKIEINKEKIENNNINNYMTDISQYSIKDLRKKYSNNNKKIALPFVDSFIEKFDIFKSQNRYNLYKNKITKNTTGKTLYVSKNGNANNDGTDINKPLNSLASAIYRASNGDTIKLLDEYITNAQLGGGTSIDKSINIEGNNCYIFYGQQYEFSQQDNLYVCGTSNITYVLNIKDLENIWHYEKKSTLIDCQNTPYSYYLNNNETLYINNGDDDFNDSDIILTREFGHSPLGVNLLTNGQVFIENCHIISGSEGCINVTNTNDVETTVIINNCETQYSHVNGIHITNGTSNDNRVNALITNSISKNNCKDGFNYGGKVSVVELNCIGNNNGLIPDHSTTNGTPNCNGSTAHQYSHVLRYNGLYYNNYGGNVADVQTECKTISINCVAYDSLANSDNGYETDFVAQQPLVTMYLLNCNSKDSESYKNIFVTDGATMYVDSLTTYDTESGTITPFEI